MATFTVRLCDLVDDGYDLGMATADYPIFDEAYRPVLNARILDHYALYEIGQETPNMFKFALNRRLREVMKYYNQLYLSEKIVFDPLSTMDYTDDTTTANALNTQADSTTQQDSTSHNTNDTVSKARVTNSELPQVHLSPDEDYASSGADTTSDTTTTGDGASATTGTSTTAGTDTANGTVNHATQGRQGPAATLLMNYRASLLNIDLMVIMDCSNLFMGVWNISDSYSRSEKGFYYGSTVEQSRFL